MNAPEAYIQFKPGLITEDGEVTDASTEEFLRNYMAEFHRFISLVYTALPRPEPNWGVTAHRANAPGRPAREIASLLGPRRTVSGKTLRVSHGTRMMGLVEYRRGCALSTRDVRFW